MAILGPCYTDQKENWDAFSVIKFFLSATSSKENETLSHFSLWTV